MTRKIDTDAVINSVRLKEQGSAPSTPAAGYANLYQAASGLYFVDDNGVVAGPLGANVTPTGRLTLTTATPVTTADVTGATTLYYTPYNGNVISLYDGERWIPVVYTEKSLSIAAYTASKPYDIWGYLSAGTLALEGLVWTNSTTRATALAYQNGRLTKSGDATRLYLGTIYVNSSGGQTDDSEAKRNVWNYYNRAIRKIYTYEATNHTYATATFRLWNNSTTNNNREFTIGVAENSVTIGLYVSGAAADTSHPWYVGVSYDATNATLDTPARVSASIAQSIELGACINHVPGIGNHYYAVVEYATAGANATLSGMALRANILG